jgi:FAD/FMN-containing dehydrogenase
MQIERLDGGKTEIADAAFQELRTKFRGSLIVPGDDEFTEARKIWNGMIDRRPGLIARCSGTADVIAAVDFARTHGLLVAVRGGGHSWPGRSVCDDGLMIDLSRMRSVRVDLATKTVRAQGGALWTDDHAVLLDRASRRLPPRVDPRTKGRHHRCVLRGCS